jgi:hypothetical protein
MNAEKCPKCNVVRVPGDRSPERLEIIERLNDERAGWFVGAVFECGSYIVPQSGRVSESAQCLRNQLAQAHAEIERLQAVVEAAAEYLSQYEGVYDMAVPTSHQSEQAKAAERRLRAALSAAPSKGEVLAVVDSTVYMQDNAAWLSIIKLPPMPDQPVTVTVRRREEER